MKTPPARREGLAQVELLSRLGDQLIPMTKLADKVREFAALCHPDTLYTADNVGEVSFADINLAEELDDPGLQNVTGIVIRNNGESHIHILNTWSRHQLLATVGTKEKWFSSVTRKQEADELNLRRAALFKHRFRTMNSVDGGVRLLRGIVSNVYGDIPDTEIMSVLLELMPNGSAVRHASGKTDKALYVYALSDQKIGIPGTNFHGFPGIVIKNSEVGFTSLWVIPTLYLPGFRLPVVFERQALLRKTHRGTMSEMKEQFEDALSRASVVWASANTKTLALTKIKFADEDAAVAKLREIVVDCGGTKMLAHRAAQAYSAQAQQNPGATHDGAQLLAALLAVVEKTDVDDAYVHATVAGAVLWRLTTT